MSVAAIVIGRNEGERLVRCLTSLQGKAAPIVYVDSGSTDGSVEAAKALGADVLNLDMSRPFTAARARNAGLGRLKELGSDAPFVQLIDGDCEMQEGWIETARNYLKAQPKVAMVAGRLRERFPEATIWNRLADAEWDTATGDVAAVGGISMLRRAAADEKGGFREDLIAGEEPEFCLRLRRRGWRIHRLPDEMAWHDIAMTKVSQWWKRCKRCGHAYAEGAALHGAGPERYRVRETIRSLAWGAGVPLLALAGAVFLTPWALGLLLLWPLQMLRLGAKGYSPARAIFLTLGTLPEALGVLGYHMGRLSGRKRALIEYK